MLELHRKRITPVGWTHAPQTTNDEIDGVEGVGKSSENLRCFDKMKALTVLQISRRIRLFWRMLKLLTVLERVGPRSGECDYHHPRSGNHSYDEKLLLHCHGYDHADQGQRNERRDAGL